MSTTRDLVENLTSKTEILYGSENALSRGIEFMKKVKIRMDIFFDHKAPSIVVDVRQYWDGYIDILNRGGKIRLVTDITAENLSYCKELMKITEMRHLAGIKGGLAISESEYMSTTVLEESHPLTEVIYSNAQALVDQGRYYFEIIWNNAIDAKDRIREIEQGITPRVTKVLDNEEDIVKQFKYTLENSKDNSIVANPGAMRMIHKNFLQLFGQSASRNKAMGNPTRWLTTIDRESIDIVNAFLNMGVEVRHSRTLVPIQFSINDKQIEATVEKLDDGKMVQSLLVSNESVYVNHFRSVFDELWRDSVDARERIREIEKGFEIAQANIIQNPSEAMDCAWNILQSAEKEIIILFASANALERWINRGLAGLLHESLRRSALSIRMIVPSGPNYESATAKIMSAIPSSEITKIDGNQKHDMNIFVADQKECMVMQVKDDSAPSLAQAIGTSVSSKSSAFVSSYHSLINSLWMETKLYEKLRIHEENQRDFINIAAHELRSSIQPILGLAELLYENAYTEKLPATGKSKLKKEDQAVEGPSQQSMAEIIFRNAKRLRSLTDAILDAASIDSGSLKLNKEVFDIQEVVSTILSEGSYAAESKQIQLVLESAGKAPVFADKTRIAQVIRNLLDNALKFTDSGKIEVSLQDKAGETIIQVRDTGAGIDPEILPKLFQKFVKGSAGGTGLGLFISKKIIEAHGGRIWVESKESNHAPAGTTFLVSLPKISKD
jgi:signal transduction histidine kinase